MRRLRWIVCFCGFFLCANGGLAEDTTFGPDEEGRGFFIAGRAAYVAGRYDEAMERFERSYEMSGRAELLYNVGTAAERAGKLARALEAYREFLAKKPESDLRPEVEKRIVELETRVSAEPVAQTVPEMAPENALVGSSANTHVAPVIPGAAAPALLPKPAAPRDAQRNHVLLPSISLAASGAVLATGVVLVALGYKAEQRVRDAPDAARWADYRDEASRALAFRGAGFPLAALGAAGAVLSTWWLVRARKDRRAPALVLGPTSFGYRRAF